MAGQPPPPVVLRRLQRIYYGPSAGGKEPGAPPSLLAIARARGADKVQPPPSEVAVLVVGDAGSGKSCFINGYAQEPLLSRCAAVSASAPRSKLPALAWVRFAGAPPGLPALLEEVLSEFPGALGDPAQLCAAVSANPRLEAADLVEVRADAFRDAATCEALAALASRAGLVVCLADSQRQPAVSPELLSWLRRVQSSTPPPLVQVVLSKVDLVVRESDRIRLTAKVSRLLSEGVGRGFEVLPVGHKDSQAVLLEAMRTVSDEAVTIADILEFPPEQLDLGTVRAVRAAQTCAAERLQEGLGRLQQDAVAAKAAAEARLVELPAPSSADATAAGLRPRLLQAAGAVGLAAAFVPLVLDEDLDTSVVMGARLLAFGVATMLLLAALAAPAAPSVAAAAQGGGKAKPGAAAAAGGTAPGTGTPADTALSAAEEARLLGREALSALAARLEEERRFCDLVLQQWALWSGTGV